MIKQGIGFALLGAVIAVLGQSMTGNSGYSAYVSGGSFYGPDTALGPWVRPVVAAAVGAVVGMLAGLVLHLSGVRFAVEPTRRVGLVVVAGLIGVTLGMTPVLVLVGASFSGPSSSVSTDYLLPIYAGTAVWRMCLEPSRFSCCSKQLTIHCRPERPRLWPPSFR
ncbi:putative calcineurin-like phosphoesterase [Rhodococcus sp. AW25M09]|uniref:hypothetical protein n=1 Tax=Rhodococcus sp. AW25M09 TaxID=1268303 RepID=UPI0002AC5C09|nr:hypothetical protein [Rhodococcus sp. AW25M09]CCQ15684.1 putative calcineurin-like phosphoesterase [Rhodococcus sp. AW25M09]